MRSEFCQKYLRLSMTMNERVTAAQEEQERRRRDEAAERERKRLEDDADQERRRLQLLEEAERERQRLEQERLGKLTAEMNVSAACVLVVAVLAPCFAHVAACSLSIRRLQNRRAGHGGSCGRTQEEGGGGGGGEIEKRSGGRGGEIEIRKRKS